MTATEKYLLSLAFVLQLICVISSVKINSNTVIQYEKYSDCHARWKAGERKPGVYNIYPNTTEPVQIYCNHTETASYTVIQRRVDAKVSFYRGWYDYKKGFGDPQGSYWAGLDTIHYLTHTGYTTLRIDMQDWLGNNRYMVYQNFVVLDEKHFYQMFVQNSTSKSVPDDLIYQNGMRFATFDYYDINKCAVNQKAGWWYNYCAYTLLNGVYYYGGPYKPTKDFYDGIYWKDWLGYGYSLKFVSMTLYK